MAPSIKLTYFNIRGLGELIRLLLKYGEIDFEDVRIENDDWLALKPSITFGQLPVIEENGKVCGQSLAIARYIAKKVNLVGDTDWENLEIDAIADTINDLKNKFAEVAHATDEDVKQKLKQNFLTETLPFYFAKLDKIAAENNGHLAVHKLTWADFYFATITDVVEILLKEVLVEDYPNLKNVKNNVVNLPAVKAWIETRPKTAY